MGSITNTKNPHVVCIPYPAQGHINPMMKLAKLLHSKGFHISFVNTHYNHNRLLRSRGPSSLDGLPDFRFYSILDGLPPSDAEATQSIPAICESVPKHSLEPFCELITRLNGSEIVPPVSGIISDGCMSFTLEAAERFSLPEVLFWTPSTCGVLAYTHYPDLVQRGYIPLKDMSDITNGYLETSLDWIPGMSNIKLREIPSFIRTTDKNDIMLNHLMTQTAAIPRGSAIILNTFDALEQESVKPLLALNPHIFTIGPLHMMQQYVHDERLKNIGSNLWKEDVSCISWLDTKEPGSVVYVNFGSITVMTKEQLIEFGWGLANSKKDFLWITRPDIVGGDEAMMPPEFVYETKGRGMVTSWCPQEEEDVSCISWLDTKEPCSVVYVNFGSITIMTTEQLIEFGWGLANSKKDFLWITRPDIIGGNEAMMPPEFVSETKGRGMVTNWCPQEEVMKHPAIGGFLTHSGWNSTIESISCGVPMVCWPFFAEQQTNCRYCCIEWGIGMEINTDVKREEVETQVREMMDGEKGKTMRIKSLEWKQKAKEAVDVGGSSYLNFDKLINDVLLKK